LVLDYRRSPEHRFPAQTDDVDRAYQWLLTQGRRPENIVSGGHSIGRNFANNLPVRLRDRGAPLPGDILAISPGYDMDPEHETLESEAQTAKVLSRPGLESFRESWLGGTGVARDDPRDNMLYADLTGLPPTMIYYGEDEIVAGDAVELAKRAEAAGVDVSLRSVPAGPHSFIMGAGPVPEGDPAIQEMGGGLRYRVGLARPAGARLCP